MCLRVYVGEQRESVHVLFDRRYQIAASFSEEFRLPPRRAGGKAEENGSLRRVVVNITDTCVCGCMSVEEAGAGEKGRDWESETKKFIFFMYVLRFFIYFVVVVVVDFVVVVY